MEHSHLIKNCARIMRRTQIHMDAVLAPYDLSSGSYPYLLELSREDDINLEQISRRLAVDKAMSTRTIQRLEALDYLTKEPDPTDSRAFRLRLTSKARKSIPEIRYELDQWIARITEGLSETDKNTVEMLLIRIEKNTDTIQNSRKDSSL